MQLACSRDATVVGRYPACEFPSPHLAKALLTTGADVTVRDVDGNTALHLAALSHPCPPPLAKTLLEAGAHLDAVNGDGKTFEMLLKDQSIYDIIEPLKYTTLTCLAARVIRRTHQCSQVPKHLQAFVAMH